MNDGVPVSRAGSNILQFFGIILLTTVTVGLLLLVLDFSPTAIVGAMFAVLLALTVILRTI